MGRVVVDFSNPTPMPAHYRSLREETTVQVSPICEFELLDIRGPHETWHLPLSDYVSLLLELKIAKIPGLGSSIPRAENAESHEDAVKQSPFRHWPGTRNRQIPLLAYNGCIELQDNEGNLIGFVSMDVAVDPVPSDLWCVHIATIHDETFRGSDPLSRMSYVFSVDNVSAITSHGLGSEYVSSTDSHILAYCLVVKPDGMAKDGYRRVGLAEVQYEWICQAPTQTISLS